MGSGNVSACRVRSLLLAVAGLTLAICALWGTPASAKTHRNADASAWEVVSRIDRGFGRMAFSDAQHGWATADYRYPIGVGIYRTSDGGRSWEWVALPGLPADARFPRTGYIACHGRSVWVLGGYEVQPGDWTTRRSYQFIARSYDGGATWAVETMEMETVDYRVVLQSIHFASSRDGWITAVRDDRTGGDWQERFLLVTHDGGRSWAKSGAMDVERFTGDDPYEIFAFVGTQHLWTAYLDWPLQRSRDGGRTWELLSLPWREPQEFEEKPLHYYEVGGLSFVDARRGWAVLIDSSDDPCEWIAVQHTEDGGVTWEEQLRIQDKRGVSPWTGLAFINASAGFLVFENRIMATHDGGETWVTEYEGSVGTWLAAVGGRVWVTGYDDGSVLLRRD